MSMNAIQRAVPVQWRCQSCGDAKPSAGECPGCGAAPVRRDRNRNRLIAPVSNMETFGNDQVQNNVVHIYGDVDCDNDYAPTPSYSHIPPQEGRSGVMTGLYARTRSVFGATPKGGAVYGVYAGLLVNFPTWQWMTLYFGWPYRAAWTFTIALFALDVVAGAIMGAVYQAMDKRAA